MNDKIRVIFLDRDGVINEFPGDSKYVNNRQEFKFISGSIEGIKKLDKCGFKIAIISNQAGVSKGLYSRKDLEEINDEIITQLENKGVKISGIYYCTHHPGDGCDCRKPKVGLLRRAISDLGVKPDETFFIGDSFKDMRAALNFKAKSILVLSGKEKVSNRSEWEFEPDYVFENLCVAADYLCSHYG